MPVGNTFGGPGRSGVLCSGRMKLPSVTDGSQSRRPPSLSRRARQGYDEGTRQLAMSEAATMCSNIRHE